MLGSWYTPTGKSVSEAKAKKTIKIDGLSYKLVDYASLPLMRKLNGQVVPTAAPELQAKMRTAGAEGVVSWAYLCLVENCGRDDKILGEETFALIVPERDVPGLAIIHVVSGRVERIEIVSYLMGDFVGYYLVRMK